jgi:hypothetical protein
MMLFSLLAMPDPEGFRPCQGLVSGLDFCGDFLDDQCSIATAFCSHGANKRGGVGIAAVDEITTEPNHILSLIGSSELFGDCPSFIGFDWMCFHFLLWLWLLVWVVGGLVIARHG